MNRNTMEMSVNSDVRYFLLNANGYGILIARKETTLSFGLSVFKMAILEIITIKSNCQNGYMAEV